MASGLQDILKVCYDESIFSATMKNYFNNLSWWRRATMVAQVGLKAAVWFVPGAGQAALLLQISLALKDAWDIYSGVRDVKEHC